MTKRANEMPQQQQQMSSSSSSPPIEPATHETNNNNNSHEGTTQKLTNGTSTTNKPNSNNNKKQNGLKNRIIQRPPPLNLNEVSNLYHVNEQTPTTTTVVATATTTSASQQQLQSNATNNQQQEQQQSTYPQFWASLNRNARTSNNNNNNNNNNGPQQTKETQISGSASGPDLVITHRSSGGTNNSLSTNRTLSSSSTLSTQPKSPHHHHHHHRALSKHHQPLISNFHREHEDDERHERGRLLLGESGDNNTSGGIDNKSYEQSNTSNEMLDDSSTHGGAPSESGGGNLIGVDQASTPPPLPVDLASASGDATIGNNNNNSNRNNSSHNDTNNIIDDYHLAAAPSSANSSATSRSRSNNPFLAMDEESNPPSPIKSSLEIFRKRPASFIAATESATTKREVASLLNDSFPNNANSSSSNIFSCEALNSTTTASALATTTIAVSSSSSAAAATSANTTTTVTSQMLQDRFNAINLNNDLHGYTSENSNQIYQQQMLSDPGNDERRISIMSQQQPIYGHHRGRPEEPSISFDSESAVCQPPPSATLQLPYWTDAIYELNNAILDTNSVAGGAENGKFIHIVENGDIILELDHVKVSGLTLSDFNELLESKPMHLLKAVQTKHSQGLTIDLRQYLNTNFQAATNDKDLQDLIRQNIYRRTIPCTTRPPRNGEVDKVDYHFLTKEQFVELNERGMLLECGMFNGHHYGTIKPYSNLDGLSIYGTTNGGMISNDLQQPMNPSHPAIGLPDPSTIVQHNPISEGIYGTQDLYGMQQVPQGNMMQPIYEPTLTNNTGGQINEVKSSSIVAVDSEALPYGWERVIDQTHGTYYIDHNTQRTQYERPFEIELTKGAMGFGFTLVEADYGGMLLVRSIIPGGPAHLNGVLRPGDILVSAVGVSVHGLQHTDVARLFSTFAVGDRVRMTFARGSYTVDDNLVPDEYLFSNGTNGDLAVAINPNSTMNYFNSNMISQDPQLHANQDFDFVTVNLKRGDSGFGFTISDSEAGQRVRKIQNNETCANLKQGDILVSLNGQDMTKLTHKQVVESLKNCPPGQDACLVIKRKKRFRSKTPMVLPTESGYLIDNVQYRNCKTPSLDYLMMKRPAIQHSSRPSSIMNGQIPPQVPPRSTIKSDAHNIYNSLPRGYTTTTTTNQPIYGTMQEIYYNQPQHVSMPTYSHYGTNYDQRTASIVDAYDTMSNSVQASDIAATPMSIANVNSVNQMNQYNNFMNNDKLMMMQNHISASSMPQVANQDYSYMPLYSNSEMLQSEPPTLPLRPTDPYYQPNHNQCIGQNYYANNEEIAMQRLQYAQSMPYDQQQHESLYYQQQPQHECEEEYEDHQIDLDKGSTDLNWGIRLIGGSEVGRAISIGSIVFGGAASKNGKLKSGDEIISINGINVVGATHQDVVELISGCTSRACLVVRRKKYAEACEVILSRNIDEGFGFVIISDENAALIGRIIKGSPADRCQQLHVRDQIVAVNGKQITPNMKHPDIVNMIKESGSTLRLRVIPAHCYTVELIKSAQNDNFGFSMRGGNEYDGMPLYILRVAPNGLARDLLNVGDQIIEINGIPTAGMTHAQAATIIKKSDPIVKLKLRHNEQIPPSLLVDSPRALQQFNQVTAEVKTVVQAAAAAAAASSATDSSSSGHLSDKSAGSFEHQHQHAMTSTLSQHQQTPGQQQQHQVTPNSNHLVQSHGLPLYAT